MKKKAFTINATETQRTISSCQELLYAKREKYRRNGKLPNHVQNNKLEPRRKRKSKQTNKE